MKNKGGFALLVLVLFGSALFFWENTSNILRNENVGAPEESPVAAAPQTIVENTEVIQFSINGAPAHKLQSEKLISDSTGRLIYITAPLIEIDTEQSGDWDATSEQGIYNQKDKSVQMLGKVILTRKYPENDPITVSTEVLNFYPDQNFAESDAAVIIETTGHIIETTGISVNFQDSVYKLRSHVRSRHDPI